MADEEKQEEVFEFPCRFPIKAIGDQEEGFESHVLEIVTDHVGPVMGTDIVTRPSRNGNFLAVTVTFTATSRAQLDALYRALTSSSRIKVVF